MPEFKERERKCKRRFVSECRAKCLNPQNAPVAKGDRIHGALFSGLLLRMGHGLIQDKSHGT